MNSEAFLSLYLEEIGVDVRALAPVSLSAPEPQIQSETKFQELSQTDAVDLQLTYPEAKAAPEKQTLLEDESSFTVEIAAQPEPQLVASQSHESLQEQYQPQVEVSEPVVQAAAYVAHEPPQAHAVAPASDDLSGLEVQAEACKACELHDSRNKLVFGSGNQQADLVFIGDAPGREEDLAGYPLAGRSGALFDRMLAAIGLSRDTVYIMNGVKCRPLHSRDPKPEEFAACERWLVAQLDMVQPKMICMLGRVVAEALLNTTASLSELRAGQYHFRGIPVLVIDHPSYLLRSQKHKQRAWDDLNRLKKQYLKHQSA